jgi:hypothetical protein
MLKQSTDGRLQRIEYRGKHLRVSRTGGIALRAQTQAAGIHLTANSKHGLRASKRIAKGTQVAFQNGRFVLRGRYGNGPTKLNLSKSGVSVSTKTDIGTVNWFKPRYSSAKIGGIQVRGKNALYLHAVIGILNLLAQFALLLFQLLVLALQLFYWLAIKATRFTLGLWSTRHQSAISAAESRYLDRLADRDAPWLKAALESIFLEIAQGHCWSVQNDTIGTLHVELATWLADSRLPQPLDLEVLFGCLAERYEAVTSDLACLELFFDLDAAAVAAGGRNTLQERLLAAYAGSCGIDVGNVTV